MSPELFIGYSVIKFAQRFVRQASLRDPLV